MNITWKRNKTEGGKRRGQQAEGRRVAARCTGRTRRPREAQRTLNSVLRLMPWTSAKNRRANHSVKWHEYDRAYYIRHMIHYIHTEHDFCVKYAP